MATDRIPAWIGSARESVRPIAAVREAVRTGCAPLPASGIGAISETGAATTLAEPVPFRRSQALSFLAAEEVFHYPNFSLVSAGDEADVAAVRMHSKIHE
jgi:hypothetical protein